MIPSNSETATASSTIAPSTRRSIMLHVDRHDFDALLAFYMVPVDVEPLPTGNLLYAFDFRLEPIFVPIIALYELLTTMGVTATAFSSNDDDAETCFSLWAETRAFEAHRVTMRAIDNLRRTDAGRYSALARNAPWLIPAHIQNARSAGRDRGATPARRS